MQYRWSVALLVSLVVVTQPAEAATKKPAKKTAVKPAPKPAPAPIAVEPKKPGGFMTPKEVVLRSPTPAEAQANAVWSIRAGLNVAALQCQFSVYLQTVNNYNYFLKHHADELSDAQAMMISHFRRYDGAKAANSFDQYNTRMYNSYSTLDAQYQFCDAAGHVGREVLALPKGKLGPAALKLYPEMRAALSQLPLSPALGMTTMEPLVLAQIEVSGD
ncbi:MAG: hypothetical protein H7268_04850 [Sandarakinorhabdus sp.]|nr:hypothetical protein [Sandarakinorhabdus sp.]